MEFLLLDTGGVLHGIRSNKLNRRGLEPVGRITSCYLVVFVCALQDPSLSGVIHTTMASVPNTAGAKYNREIAEKWDQRAYFAITKTFVVAAARRFPRLGLGRRLH